MYVIAGFPPENLSAVAGEGSPPVRKCEKLTGDLKLVLGSYVVLRGRCY